MLLRSTAPPPRFRRAQPGGTGDLHDGLLSNLIIYHGVPPRLGLRRAGEGGARAVLVVAASSSPPICCWLLLSSCLLACGSGSGGRSDFNPSLVFFSTPESAFAGARTARMLLASVLGLSVIGFALFLGYCFVPLLRRLPEVTAAAFVKGRPRTDSIRCMLHPPLQRSRSALARDHALIIMAADDPIALLSWSCRTLAALRH